MCLRFVFLLVTRLLVWPRLYRREEAWKDAEILLLRHQLTVLRRQATAQPKLSWADRTLIAALLSRIPRVRLASLSMIVNPDTVLRWHRDIVRRRWAPKSHRKRPGRPATRRNIRGLILRLARENPGWGYRRIHGKLAGLGIRLAASTVWETLRRAGIDPAPRRNGPAWSEFLPSQAQASTSTEFFPADP
ncbi:MAG: hypothetical protein ACR2MP_34645, partial [Streptosporangiaceae bacterium]